MAQIQNPLIRFYGVWERFVLTKRSRFHRYFASVVMAGLMLPITILLHHLGMLHIYFLCVAGSVLVSIYGGVGPALLAATLMTISFDYFHIEPLGQIFSTHEEFAFFGFSFLTTAALSFITGSMRSAYAFASKARRKAEIERRAREETLAIVAHDLKGPIKTISLCKDLIQKDPANVDRATEMIRQSVESMRRLVEDLLMAQKIDEGKLPINLERLDLIPVIERLVESLQVRAQEKSISISLSCGLEQWCCLSDPKRFEQILSNLIGNAIKFSAPRQPIEVLVSTEKEGLLQIEVKDHGPGMSRQTLKHLFDRFYQGGESSREIGSGLGLYIAQTLARAMNGKIEVQSELNKGSSFTITLPKNQSIELRQSEAA